MQRRAAALYAALFLVLAASGYATIGVAQEPAIAVENPDVSVSPGGEFSVGDRTYTVESIEDERGSLTWVEPDVPQSAMLPADSTVTLEGTEFAVEIPAEDDPSTVTLREVQPLPDDVDTTTVDGTSYVVLEEAGELRLVPEDEYRRDRLGEPATRAYAVGDRLAYENQTATVASITQNAVTLEWTAPTEDSVSMSEGDVVELNGREYVAHFPGPATLALSTDVEAYERQVAAVETYHERSNGLWGVAIIGSLAAALLLGLAYGPSRY